MSDVSGSDYDTISDISSLGSYAESFAVQAAQDAAAKEAAKKRRKSTKLRNRVNSDDLDEGSSRRRSTSTRRKSKMPGSQPLTEESLAAQQRQEARKTKRMKLKGLNDRILGVEDDLSDFGDSKSANDAPIAQPVVTIPLVSVSAPESPLRPSTPQGSRQPSRAPSPKINLLGSSRVAPSVPAEATSQSSYNNQETIPLQLPPFSPHPSPAGIIANHSPPVEAVVSTLSEVGSRPGSSLGGTFSNPSPRGSFASSTGAKNAMPSAVSERRKAAAAARAAKVASSKNNTKDPNAPMEATQETASNASSATAPTSTDREVSGEPVRVREPAKVPAIAKAKSKRRAARGTGSSGSSEASSESAEFSSSEEDSDGDERSRKRRKEKQKQKERDKEKQKQKEKEKDKERRAKEKQREEKEREKEKEKEKEKDMERARKEREAEEERQRKEEETRRAEKKNRKEAAEVTPPSSSSAPKPAPPLDTRSLSFGKRGGKDPFCRLIKSTTYLNAIRIVHGDVPKVLCASADSTVQIHSILDGSQLSPLVGHTDRVISLAVSNPFMYAEKNASGVSSKPTLKTLVASGSRDEQLRIWDMDTGRCLHAIHAHKSPIWAVGIAVRPDGDVIVVTTSGDGGMRSWNGKTGKKINNFKGHSDKILSVFIMNPLAEVPLVLSAGSDKKIRVWDLLTGAHIRMLEGHEDEINSVVAGAFSGISSLVPIRHASESGKEHAAIPGLDPGKSTVIVSGSKDLTVRVWDFRSGHLLFELLGHTACVYEVAIIRARDSPLANGSAIPAGTPIIVSCSEDATVKLWNLITGKLITSLKWHSVSVRGIDVASVVLQGGDASTGTALIASCGWDKTIQFHELGEALYAKKASMCSIM